MILLVWLFSVALRAMASSFLRFLDHTQRRNTVGRTPLDKWSVLRRDLYLITHNTHNRQTSMSPGGIRTHDLSKRAAADLRLRPRGYWDRRNDTDQEKKNRYILRQPCSGVTLSKENLTELYSGDISFEFPTDHWLSREISWVCCPSREVPG